MPSIDIGKTLICKSIYWAIIVDGYVWAFVRYKRYETPRI